MFKNLEKKVDNFCGLGWTTFGEEKCFKIFKPTLSFVDAQSYCARRGGYLRAHLPTVNSQKEQDFLLNFLSTQKQFKNRSFWLGAERNGSDHEQSFKWTSDQVELDHSNFTNWAPGSPRPSTDSVDYCLTMTVNSSGQWYDEPCTKRRHVFCERPPQWMLEKMQQTLAKLEKVFLQFLIHSATVTSAAKNATLMAEDALNAANTAIFAVKNLTENAAFATFVAKKAIDSAKTAVSAATRAEKAATDATSGAKMALTAASTAISFAKNSTDTAISAIFMAENATKTAANATESVAKTAKTTINLTIPLGFIYVQLPKEKSPVEIWPNWMSWNDVSDQYDSNFFRVAGSKSAVFGAVQEASSPYVDKVKSTWCLGECDHVGETVLPRNGGWSETLSIAYVKGGDKDWYRAKLNFHVAGNGEVRPSNMAVKVWKRIG